MSKRRRFSDFGYVLVSKLEQNCANFVRFSLVGAVLDRSVGLRIRRSKVAVVIDPWDYPFNGTLSPPADLSKPVGANRFQVVAISKVLDTISNRFAYMGLRALSRI